MSIKVEPSTIALVTQKGKMTTRDRIISAAKEEFFSMGYDAARMRSISERAEINKGLLHYYFKTKEALMVEVFQETFQDFFRSIAAATDHDQDVFKMVASVVELYMEHMIKNPSLPYFIINEMNRDPERHFKRMKKAAVQPPFAPMMQMIEKVKSNGGIRKDVDPEQFMINLISMTLFPFIAKNMLTYMHGMSDKDYNEFLKNRTQEITHTLIASLKA